MTISKNRYNQMIYRRCGRSGLLLPAISLGLWFNFGSVNNYANSREMIIGAFNSGITHFDIANNYGPEPGSAEETFGKVMRSDLKNYRDEIIVSTKAGYHMWPGPYGEWGSKKSLVASLDQSLQRLGLDYVDIYYHHRPDPDTPLEETAEALALLVFQGKTLYVGISNYSPEDTERAYEILKKTGIRCLVHQQAYSMISRKNEALYPVLNRLGMGSVAFKPLAQGLLTNRYLAGIPEDSRASSANKFLTPNDITPEIVSKIQSLHMIARKRGQSLAQMALAWVLRPEHATSAIIGASRLAQIDENVKAIDNLAFSADEYAQIDSIMNQ
jgi:L-glyceraldehyde 3-phosphate reductase